MTGELKSKCCGTKTITYMDVEGASYYTCSECQNACDAQQQFKVGNKVKNINCCKFLGTIEKVDQHSPGTHVIIKDLEGACRHCCHNVYSFHVKNLEKLRDERSQNYVRTGDQPMPDEPKTLRDEFAMAAMTAVVRNTAHYHGRIDDENIGAHAQFSYKMADAMLETRKQK